MLKKIINKLIKHIADRISYRIEERRCNTINDESVAQKCLAQHYRKLALDGKNRLPSFQDAGFRKYSQFEEDGILLLIFSLIQPINRTCVEICAGEGRECCTSNLIINHGWWGHLFDGDPENVRKGKEFFRTRQDTFLYPPRFTQAWITAENVNDLISKSGASGPIDLLSIDMDGVDYWIWEAITCIEPTVVLCETHNPIPADKALTVPYKADFCAENENYRSASLAAMTKLAKRKGYRLVGTHRYGFNAFFIKNGFGEEFFPEVDVASCLQDPYSTATRESRWLEAQKYDWHEV